MSLRSSRSIGCNGSGIFLVQDRAEEVVGKNDVADGFVLERIGFPEVEGQTCPRDEQPGGDVGDELEQQGRRCRSGSRVQVQGTSG